MLHRPAAATTGTPQADARIDRTGDGEVELRHVLDGRMRDHRRLVVLLVGRGLVAVEHVVAEGEAEGAGDVVHVRGRAFQVRVIADQEQPSAGLDEIHHRPDFFRRESGTWGS